jgi:hypothetical protein
MPTITDIVQQSYCGFLINTTEEVIDFSSFIQPIKLEFGVYYSQLSSRDMVVSFILDSTLVSVCDSVLVGRRLL